MKTPVTLPRGWRFFFVGLRQIKNHGTLDSVGICGLQILVRPCAIQVLDAQCDPVLWFGE